MDIRNRNRCGENPNYPHFGSGGPFEIIAGPCTPLYESKNVKEMSTECRNCMQEEIEYAGGGINNCQTACIQTGGGISGVCPNIFLDTPTPLPKAWCDLASCVKKQEILYQNQQCSNPCKDMARVLFDNDKMKPDDYCS